MKNKPYSAKRKGKKAGRLLLFAGKAAKRVKFLVSLALGGTQTSSPGRNLAIGQALACSQPCSRGFTALKARGVAQPRR